MSDVTATLQLARALRQSDEVLFDLLLANRFKTRVESMIDTLRLTPLVHISGLMGTNRSCLGVVVPLAMHPEFKSDVICADLSRKPEFLTMAPELIRTRLFAKSHELASPEERPGLMTIKVNKAPILLPMSHVTPECAKRLGLSGQTLRQYLNELREAKARHPGEFTQHLQDVYRDNTKKTESNPDAALYGAFVPGADRRLIQEVRDCSPAELRDRRFGFSDPRLPELLFRYRARNWPDILTESERKHWRDHCREQWLNSSHLNLEMFQKVLLEELSRDGLTEKQAFALNELQRWVSEQWEILDVSTASV